MQLGWILSIVSGSIVGVVLIIMGIGAICLRYNKHLMSSQEFFKSKGEDYWDLHNEFTRMCIGDNHRDKVAKYNEIYSEYEEYKRSVREHNDRVYDIRDNFFFVNVVVLILIGGILLCSVIATTISLVSADYEVAEYTELASVYKDSILNGTDLENFEVTKDLIEYNSWLAKAKADKRAFGIASKYFYQDLDSLQPLVIRTKEKEQC